MSQLYNFYLQPADFPPSKSILSLQINQPSTVAHPVEWGARPLFTSEETKHGERRNSEYAELSINSNLPAPVLGTRCCSSYSRSEDSMRNMGRQERRAMAGVWTIDNEPEIPLPWSEAHRSRPLHDVPLPRHFCGRFTCRCKVWISWRDDRNSNCWVPKFDSSRFTTPHPTAVPFSEFVCRGGDLSRQLHRSNEGSSSIS